MGDMLNFARGFVSDAGRLKGDGDFLPKDCPTVSNGECKRCPDEICENHPANNREDEHLHPADSDCFAVANMDESQVCTFKGDK